jgi:hypothetical protein
MSRESVGVGGAVVMNDIGTGGIGGVGPVFFSLGVIVVRGTWAAGAGKGSEWGWRLSQISRGSFEDAVVIDNSDVGTGGRFGLGQEKARRQEKSGGLGAEDAASGCHGRLSFRRKEYHDE